MYSHVACCDHLLTIALEWRVKRTFDLLMEYWAGSPLSTASGSPADRACERAPYAHTARHRWIAALFGVANGCALSE